MLIERNKWVKWEIPTIAREILKKKLNNCTENLRFRAIWQNYLLLHRRRRFQCPNPPIEFIKKHQNSYDSLKNFTIKILNKKLFKKHISKMLWKFSRYRHLERQKKSWLQISVTYFSQPFHSPSIFFSIFHIEWESRKKIFPFTYCTFFLEVFFGIINLFLIYTCTKLK